MLVAAFSPSAHYISYEPLERVIFLAISHLLYKIAGVWDVLVELVMALQHAEGSVKSQWLVDAAEISCVTSYPTTVSTNSVIISTLITEFYFLFFLNLDPRFMSIYACLHSDIYLHSFAGHTVY